MIDEYLDWIRKNANCCACGGKMETSTHANFVELNKVATWKFPIFGSVDVPGFEPRALAIVCNECMANNTKIQRCIEWEGTPYQIIYHDVDGLKDCSSMSQIDYYFGKLFRQRKLIRKAARQESVN